MPYIDTEKVIALQFGALAQTKGELNFLITELLVSYLVRKGLNYQNISDVIAAAQDAADEMKRRVLADYEDAKRKDPNNIDPYNALSRGSHE